MSQKVHVYVGTSKGAFIFESDAARKKWKSTDILFKGWDVMHMRLDPRDQRLHAATAHFAYGPTTHFSDDFGKTWTQAGQVPPALWKRCSVPWVGRTSRVRPRRWSRSGISSPAALEKPGFSTRARSRLRFLSRAIAERPGP